MSMKKYVKYTILLIPAVFFSCNIFGGMHRDPEKYGAEALVLEGKRLMQEKDWTGAQKMFQQARGMKNTLSEAYFYEGKCILRINSVDLNQVWGEINPQGELAKQKNVPFLYNPPAGKKVKDKLPSQFTLTINGVAYSADTLIDSVFLQRKRIYDAVSQSIRFLDTINIRATQMDGAIKREQFESDYLVEVSIKTILGIIDINKNDTLDYYTDFTSKKFSQERNAFRILCLDIPSLDSMDFDSLKSISKNPKDIKKNLDSILSTLNKADSSFNNFKIDLINGQKQKPDLDTGMANNLGKMISNFKKILPYFYYNDFINNDRDYWNTNNNRTIDRMVWIDWDLDKKIDIYRPDTSVHAHIGDSLERLNHPEYYDTTGVGIDPDNKKDKRYKYRGPYTFEFIAGDWGVDEEIMDGKDNDQDGFVDEDTRVAADTLDDDGDFYKRDSLPMVWRDTVTPDFLITINDNLHWDTVSVSLEFRTLYTDIYKTFLNKELPENLRRYKGTPPKGEFISGDYGLDEEWYDGLDNDGDDLIDEDVGERLPPVERRLELIQELGIHGMRGDK